MRESIVFDDFSGGLDLVSDISNISAKHTPFAQNCRITPDGSIVGLSGYSGNIDLGASTNARDLFYYEKRDGSSPRIIVATQTAWKSLTNPAAGIGGASTSNIRTSMTSHDDNTFVIHNDLLYGLDPQNDIGTWDGTTLNTYAAGVNTGPNKGIILGVWNNIMWTAVATAGVVGMRVEWSAIADPTNGFVNTTDMWPAANYVVLGGSGSSSEKIVGGMPTPDGLLVFTTDSIYLIYDTDGSNVVVDPYVGCVSRRTIQRHNSIVYFANNDGIYAVSGRLPAQPVAPLIQPYFRLQGMVTSTVLPCATVFDGSYWLAFMPNDITAATGIYNRAAFEINLETGAAMWHTGPISNARCFTVAEASSGIPRRLIQISSNTAGGAADGRIIYDQLSGSNGLSATGVYYQLPYGQQDTGQRKRMRDIEAVLGGSWTTYPVSDYAWLASTSSAPYGPFAFTTPADSSGTYDQMHRAYARPSGVSGHVLSAMLAATNWSTDTNNSNGNVQNPYPIGNADRKIGPILSRAEIRYDRSSRRDY